MNIIKRTENIKENTISIVLPQEYVNKTVEIIIIPVSEKKRHFKSIDKISLNTKDLKFDRDELHRR